MEDEYLTVSEVAKRLRVTRQAVYNWIADGRLEAVRIGGKAIRIPVSSVLAIIRAVSPGEPIEGADAGQWEPALIAA